ncbi:MAG: hypothetical protein AB8H86_05380 [Polyangiales bacterium]
MIGAVLVFAVTAGGSRLVYNAGVSSSRSSGGESEYELQALSFLGVASSLGPLGSAVSIWQGGRGAGGNANYGLTLLGSFTGTVVGGGAATLLALSAEFEQLLWAAPLIAGVFQYAGGLLAYHFSDKARAAHVSDDETTLLLEPYFASSRAGFALGLGGRF